jgi:membrane protein
VPAFAGVLLIVVSVSQLFLGCDAVSGDSIDFSDGGYWYRNDDAALAWVNLGIGIVGVPLGLSLFGVGGRLGRLRGRAGAAMAIGAVSAANQCLLAPWYPLWSALVIVLDLFLVWALATRLAEDADGHGEDGGIVRLDAPAAPNWHGGRMGRRSFAAAAKRFFSENRLDDAAALTYYSVLSLFPAILVGTSLIGMLDENATRELLEGIEDVAPADAMSIIENAVTGLQTNPATAGVMALVGLAAALWAASNYVAAFSRALNEVNGTGETRKWWTVLIVRLVLTLVVGALTAVCALVAATGGGVATAIGKAVGAGGTAVTVWTWVKWPIILVLVMVIVALLYWLAPARHSTFRFRAPGAVVAVLLWVVASAAFGLYVASFADYDKTYGTLGGVIVFLVWLWITNAVLLFGSEYNVSANAAERSEDGEEPRTG